MLPGHTGLCAREKSRQATDTKARTEFLSYRAIASVKYFRRTE